MRPHSDPETLGKIAPPTPLSAALVMQTRGFRKIQPTYFQNSWKHKKNRLFFKHLNLYGVPAVIKQPTTQKCYEKNILPFRYHKMSHPEEVANYMHNVSHQLTNLVHNESICMYSNLKNATEKRETTILINKRYNRVINIFYMMSKTSRHLLSCGV